VILRVLISSKLLSHRDMGAEHTHKHTHMLSLDLHTLGFCARLVLTAVASVPAVVKE